jgi:hypothetical protein
MQNSFYSKDNKSAKQYLVDENAHSLRKAILTSKCPISRWKYEWNTLSLFLRKVGGSVIYLSFAIWGLDYLVTTKLAEDLGTCQHNEALQNRMTIYECYQRYLKLLKIRFICLQRKKLLERNYY